VLSGAVIWFARNWISEKLKNSIKHEYDQKLVALNAELKSQADTQVALLKASIEKESAKLHFATSSIGEIQKAAMNRKLDAIDTLWQGVLSVRENIPPVMWFLDILTVEEYKSSRDHPNFNELVGDLSGEELTQMLKDDVGLLERVRPYTGEYLWALFSTYQILIVRVAVLIQWGTNDAEKLNWHQDSGIKQLLHSSLSTQELQEFEEIKINKVSWLQRKYEAKILFAMEKIVSGLEFGKEALKQAQIMEEQVQQLKLKQRKDMR